jgi:hypothetical protein
MKILYCWRCKTDIPMLDTQEEMDRVMPHLYGEAQPGGNQIALDAYFAITGCRATVPNALWHHLASLYGPPCKGCGKPLRTPQATMCPMCGMVVAATPKS